MPLVVVLVATPPAQARDTATGARHAPTEQGARENRAVTVDDGWQEFQFGAPGSIQPLVAFSSTIPVVVSITDAFCVGDRYLLRDFDVLLAQSSIPPVPESCSSPYERSAQRAFSGGYFAAGLSLLPAGSHELSVMATVSPFGAGTGFVRVDSCTRFLRRPGTLVGTSAADTLCGTGGRDTILGGDGSDRIAAGGGLDVARGGPGDDAMAVEGDADTAYGELGADRVFGGTGDDVLSGGPGADALSADGDRDRVSGDGGPDVVLGEGGEDVLTGGPGNDVLNGGQHADRLDGGTGVDRCLQATGDQRVRCESAGTGTRGGAKGAARA